MKDIASIIKESMGIDITDPERELYLAAAKAKLTANSIEGGTRAIRMRLALGETIRNYVTSTRGGIIPVENAILCLNEFCGKKVDPAFGETAPIGVGSHHEEDGQHVI